MISFVSGYYGWLGNQMFQYAATRALTLHVGARMTGFPKNRPSLYDIFPINAMPIHNVNRHEYREQHFHYAPGFWSQPDGTELSGYFQSEKYFAPYAKEIRAEFTRESHTVFDEGLVSVHVRRGDYLSFPEHHPPLTMDYYNAAMEHFPGAKFLIFSDDPGWCLLNFDRSRCEVSVGRKPEDDLTLMSDCSDHIIANSSFSWWGAYLGRNPEKKVIAPVRWFGPAKKDWSTKDLLPDGWVKL
jgi:hypothetical protein